MQPLSTYAAALFTISLLFTYLWVRLNWVSIPHASIVGFIFNSLAFLGFAMSRGSTVREAISVGLMQGLIFTAAAVTMGAFFRNTSVEDLAQEKQALRYTMEQVSRDQKV